MKVAMLSPNLPPRRCGVGDTAYRLSRELASAGHSVVLFARAAESENRWATPYLETAVIPGPPWHSKTVSQLAREVAIREPEVFHYHYVPFLYGERGLSLGASLLPTLVRRAGIPVVTTLHELAMPWSLFPPRFAIACLQRLQLALLVAGSEELIVTTRHRQSKLRAWFPWRADRVHAVPVGSTVEVTASGDGHAIRAELGLDGRVVLGFFGTTHPSKDLRLVARCVQVIVAEGVDALLLCIGPERRELAESLGKWTGEINSVLGRAVCTGWVPTGERLSRLLSSVDIFLLPLADGVSTLRTTAMAAMAHGLAIVGTRGRETDAEVFGSDEMHLVPAGDEQAFLDAVLLLAREPDRRARLGRNARDLYLRRFTWPRLAESTIEVYSMAVGRYQRGKSPAGATNE